MCKYIFKKFVVKSYSNPSVYAVVVAAQKPRKSKFALYKSQYRQKMFKKMSKKFLLSLSYLSLCKFFLDKDRKSCNRKPRNGKPRKTRDYCSSCVGSKMLYHHGIIKFFLQSTGLFTVESHFYSDKTKLSDFSCQINHISFYYLTLSISLNQVIRIEIL